MAKAIEILMNEHRDIERVLDVMSGALAGARQGGQLDLRLLAKVAHFIQTFADDLHHAKEEKILFPAMIAHGVPRDRGPLACMLGEHEYGRYQSQRFRLAIAGLSGGDESMRPILLEAAAQYEELLRAHIQKEDGFLYRLALQVLPAPVLESMAGAFEEADGVQSESLSAAADTLERIAVPPGAVLSTATSPR